MARRGKFGRMPKAQPSITNQLIAIAREMQNQRDQNIMDAWKNGGMFEGKKATDELVLAHWAKRLENVDKSDPLYDTYKNTILQYEYAIEESKMSVRHAQGKVTDRQMAQFYLNWAKKVPRNSEFYRILQRDGAQLMRTAKAREDADRKQREEERYQRDMENEYQSGQAGADYLLTLFTKIAAVGMPEIGLPTPVLGEGEGLNNFDAADPDNMMTMINAIMTGVYSAGRGAAFANPNVLFVDPETNKPVTGEDIINQLTKLDPKNFNGKLDMAYVRGLLDRQRESINSQIRIAQKTGHTSDVESLKKKRAQVNELGRQVSAWPVANQYMDARNEYAKVAGDPKATPMQKVAAWEEYQATLFSLAEDPAIASDSRMKSQLLAEANMTVGVPTLAEDFTGAAGGVNPNTGGENAVNAAQITYQQEQIDMVADPNNGMTWTQGSYVMDKATGTEIFVPEVGGKSTGYVSIDEMRKNANGALEAVMVPDGNGGFIKMLIASVPVHVGGVDPATGKKITVTNGNAIAEAFVVTVDGVEKTLYRYQTPSGQSKVTWDPPWNSDIPMTKTKDGYELNLTKFLPTGDRNVPTTDLGNGLKVVGGRRAGTQASGAGSQVVTAKPGTLEVDPFLWVFNTDPARRNLPDGDPAVDFDSVNQALYMDGTAEGTKKYNELLKNPEYRDMMDNYWKSKAGYQSIQNPDGSFEWLTPTPEAQSKYWAMKLDHDNITSGYTRGRDGLLDETRAIMNRAKSKPLPTFMGRPVDEAEKWDDKMPADRLRGTDWAAAAGAFTYGTASIAAYSDPANATAIKAGHPITVPSGVKSTVAPTVATTATPTTSAVNTTVPGWGSQPTSYYTQPKPAKPKYGPVSL